MILVENSLTEYYRIMDFICQVFLGGLKYFKNNFASPIEKFRDKNRLEILKKITAPFIMRSVKTDKTIICDLPDKISVDEFFTPQADARRKYYLTI